MNVINMPRKGPMTGQVKPPADLNPAIDALTDIGRAWLNKRTEGRKVTPHDIAKAADHERNE